MKFRFVSNFIFCIFLIGNTNLLFAQETKATEMELEAESYEERGYPKKANLIREKIKRIRKENFQSKEYEPIYIPPNQKLPTTKNGSLEFLNGTWEFGFRFLSQNAGFRSGKEWALDDGRVAFQAGTPYFPRSPMGYQNIRTLPYQLEWEDTRKNSDTFSPRISYQHSSKKWGMEYVYMQFNTTRNFFSMGDIAGFQLGFQTDRFYSADHKLSVLVHDEYSHNKRFVWEFGFRMGSLNTNSSQNSQSLGQTGLFRDSIQYVAPSTGFKFVHQFFENYSYELGGDLFFTPVGNLKYRRDSFTSNGGVSRFGGERTTTDEVYSLFSEKRILTTIVGLNLNAQLNWVPFPNHKFHLGLQAIQYNWRANESQAPGLRALNQESYLAGVRDYFVSSAYYEADGGKGRPMRSYGISNLYFGYTYVY
ncbi:hypothetical protein EHQ96_01155 [Leptospira levettii]|uniref:Porin n=1 Tax=Leptospira levettii TaxID=2023178 RepID=A0A5F2DCK0_9LEPT|nr:hypothetical protein [Leptospira levettii]PKA28100.1 hypothetical protein CH381_01880 [Leptospira sp. mixed culture ATI2-C-A1]MCW7467447.1 hypothetical protein [Leptospira levettii]MCW7513169.1 hypothetical protein [Leptospira levettii]MCW7516697.1 hypothetical protein [Leptospira levettii]TGL25370.1 hypothetical protein EHQ42_02030 [Leptospira levettii]